MAASIDSLYHVSLVMNLKPLKWLLVLVDNINGSSKRLWSECGIGWEKETQLQKKERDEKWELLHHSRCVPRQSCSRKAGVWYSVYDSCIRFVRWLLLVVLSWTTNARIVPVYDSIRNAPQQLRIVCIMQGLSLSSCFDIFVLVYYRNFCFDIVAQFVRVDWVFFYKFFKSGMFFVSVVS